MKMKKPNVAVLGDGGWGTVLAILLHKKGVPVTIWSAFSDYALWLNQKRVNSRFLPGVKIPKGIRITSDIKSALGDKQLVIIAVPSQYLRGVLGKIKKSPYPTAALYLSVSKGIDRTLKRMSEVIVEELGIRRIAVLSGPTIAIEVAKRSPTTAVISSGNRALRKYLQDLFMTERFRIYTNSDMIGTELGGSLKNVIAIACGVSDGLGFGTNAKAALLCRGLAEISRLGKAMGAKTATFSGISGLGDLVTTCVSPYSRNRFVGECIGKGKSLKEIKGHMQMVAEGVPTARSAYLLGKKHKIEMPITREVYNMLYRCKPPLKAVRDLMTRRKKEE